MTFPAYKRYKPSGIEWIGEIPDHWSTERCGWLFSERNEKNHPDLDLLSVTQAKGIVRQSDLTERKDSSSEDKTNYKRVCPEDLAYNKMRMWQGAIGVSQYEGIVSPAYVVLRPNKPVVSRFFYYLFKTKTFVQECARGSYGICDDMNSLRYKDFKTIYAPVPPLQEQRAITAFLDRETEKIDRLIEKQEQLIKLLEEKRQAEISHSVTKGLNPNAAMKDSGIEWLSEIPQHWSIVNIKRTLKYLTSGSRGWSDYIGETGPLFLQSGNIGRNMDVTSKSAQRVTLPNAAEGHRTIVQKGDILVCITGGRTGSVGIVRDVIEEAYVNQHVALTRVNTKSIHPVFASYCLYSELGQRHFSISQYGLKEGLGLDDVKKALVTIPPLEEQLSIIDWLDRRAETYQRSISQSTRLIESLSSKRASLISAAVTGKIDVLGLVAIESEDAA